MDQCITRYVLHATFVYSMDTNYILCCNNTTLYVETQRVHDCLVNVPMQYSLLNAASHCV